MAMSCSHLASGGSGSGHVEWRFATTRKAQRSVSWLKRPCITSCFKLVLGSKRNRIYVFVSPFPRRVRCLPRKARRLEMPGRARDVSEQASQIRKTGLK